MHDENKLGPNLSLGECTIRVSDALAHSNSAIDRMRSLEQSHFRTKPYSNTLYPDNGHRELNMNANSTLEADAASARKFGYAPGARRSINNTSATMPLSKHHPTPAATSPPVPPIVLPMREDPSVVHTEWPPSAPPLQQTPMHEAPPAPFAPGSDYSSVSSHDTTFDDASKASMQERASCHLPQHQGGLNADFVLQQLMSQKYQLQPSGLVSLVVVDALVANLSDSNRAVPFRQFVNHKFMHSIGETGKKPLMSSKFGKAVAHVAHSAAGAARNVHPALDFLYPLQAALQEHPTWKIETGFVEEIFGSKRQPWNRSYDAAKMIFAGHMSVTVRKMIQAQHSYLYGGLAGVKPLVDMRKDLAQTNGRLLGGDDFLELVKEGYRAGKPRFFSYVIMSNRMYFAETGAKFFKDINSKRKFDMSFTFVLFEPQLPFANA